MSWLRALAAAGLSILFPGAGHAVLREWLRAILFATLFLSSLLVFLPIESMGDAGTTIDMLEVAYAEMDTISQFAISFIVVFAAVDAAFRALDFPPGRDETVEGPTCPECGRSLDEDLEFCHWCTTRLDSTPGSESP